MTSIRRSGTTNLLCWMILASLVFFIAAMTLFTQLLMLLEPAIDGIDFVITGSRTSFLFSLTAAFIPILTVLTWRVSRIDSLNRRIFSAAIIIFSMATALLARHQQVKIYFTRVVRPMLLTEGKTHVIYPIDPRNFVYYLLGGLLVGCLLSNLILRQKNRVSVQL